MIRLKLAIELEYGIAVDPADFVFDIHAAQVPGHPVFAEAVLLSQAVVATVLTDGPGQAGPAGRSRSRGLGFTPAFLDFDTFTIYPSRFANGCPAPLHLLDGLPDEVVVDRAASGRALAAKATLIAGFVRSGYFYTRTAAARAALEWARP